MNIRKFKTIKERREALEKELSIDLKNIGSSLIDPSIASVKNCENMIGFAQIPMGVAGPLIVERKEHHIPLATTEGALIASVSRGCKAITQSGGAHASSFRIGTTRGLVFRVDGIEHGKELAIFIYSHTSDFDAVSKKTSGHISLLEVTVKSLGRQVFVRLSFHTDEAMGMNMVTIASDAIASYIETHTRAVCVSVASNYDVDKKPSWLNAIRGRGFEIRADVVIPSRVLSDVLKTTAQNVYEVWLSKCMIGSALSGSMGFNAQYANIVAALFLATGQDVAHVVEGSMGITTCEVDDDNLYMSVYLPDCMIGTVGGGTRLPTQKEALSLLGKAGSNVELFGEIIGVTVLAGEISLLSSLAEGSLTKAHKRFGRGEAV